MEQIKNEDDEARLFLEAVRDVRPIKHRLAEMRMDRQEVLPGRAGVTRDRERDDADNPVDGSSFKRSGVQTNVLKRLRMGHIPIEDELDLHGYSSREAEPQLHTFLLNARLPDRQRGVRVIHGKGLGSAGGKSILRDKTQRWLRESEAVLAFCAAGPSNGGTGAVHVLLRKR